MNEEVDSTEDELICWYCGQRVDPNDDRALSMLMNRNVEVPVCGDCAEQMWLEEEFMLEQDGPEGERLN